MAGRLSAQLAAKILTPGAMTAEAGIMCEMSLRGVVGGKKVSTTPPDTTRPCPDDKVNRTCHPERPNRLWGEPLFAIGSRPMASDFTYVSTRSGTVHVALVIGVFARRIARWRIST